MKKTAFVAVAGFIAILVLAFNADAQMMKGRGMPCGEMQGCCGMTGGMGGCMQQGMHGGMHQSEMGMDHGHSFWKHLGCLGLNEKQDDALKALRTGTMTDMIRKKAEKQIAEMELKDLLDKDVVDMKAAEKQLKKVASIKTDMVLSHLRAKEKVKAILTPEQWQRLKGMMEMGKGGPGPGCRMMMQDDMEGRDDGPAGE